MVKLVDTRDLKSLALLRVGSSPTIPTTQRQREITCVILK